MRTQELDDFMTWRATAGCCQRASKRTGNAVQEAGRRPMNNGRPCHGRDRYRDVALVVEDRHPQLKATQCPIGSAWPLCIVPERPDCTRACCAVSAPGQDPPAVPQRRARRRNAINAKSARKNPTKNPTRAQETYPKPRPPARRRNPVIAALISSLVIILALGGGVYLYAPSNLRTTRRISPATATAPSQCSLGHGLPSPRCTNPAARRGNRQHGRLDLGSQGQQQAGWPPARVFLPMQRPRSLPPRLRDRRRRIPRRRPRSLRRPPGPSSDRDRGPLRARRGARASAPSQRRAPTLPRSPTPRIQKDSLHRPHPVHGETVVRGNRAVKRVRRNPYPGGRAPLFRGDRGRPRRPAVQARVEAPAQSAASPWPGRPQPCASPPRPR